MVSRIRIDQNKALFVQSLIGNKDNPEGVFETYADIVAFAAAVGKKYDCRLPLEHISQEPSPISLDVFISRGYDLLMDILAITTMEDVQCLAGEGQKKDEQRIIIFEEYANGGLSYLQEQLVGAIDYQERILLLLNQERYNNNPVHEFDLSRFL
ncbi:hypothetical protein Cyast_0581 [Cyanobacterium stanieri PCC 7202]|uniref:Dnd system-associated protein 4 n=1 Tax=Cyanobacterium stanieri (strain ATCC 29140 / PCC 7202) TaxID=292563 RepID=K9YI76_CYASC|nr:hypothetical protein Cyast_0581 [Cyanobacterium stanieri PCC 7202]